MWTNLLLIMIPNLNKRVLFQKEVELMTSFKHQNLLTLRSVMIQPDFVMMQMPLQERRSCDQIISGSYYYGLPEEAIGMIIKDVLNGLLYLHNKNMVHRYVQQKVFNFEVFMFKSSVRIISVFLCLLLSSVNFKSCHCHSKYRVNQTIVHFV